MKNCQICGNQNSDDMRFCLNCGKPLPDAPIVFNLKDSGSQGGQSSPGTNPYGKSMETQFGARPNQPQNYSMVPPTNQGSGGSSKKIFIAIGGVVALFLLILAAGAAIIGYNVMKKKDIVTLTPTPLSSPSNSPSASPSSSKSPSPTPKPTDSPNSSVSNNTANVKVKFSKVWVDYNKTETDGLGMWVHLKFEVTNLKGVDSHVIIYFQKSDGTSLNNGTGDYRASDGRVAAIKDLKPGFDTTVYEDLEIFMPYSQLNLTSGKYNLKMDIDLTDDDQKYIQHLTYKEFEYTKD
ncbi:MAG: zinc ribbon domain-containing protein [Actinomycetota bacterium]